MQNNFYRYVGYFKLFSLLLIKNNLLPNSSFSEKKCPRFLFSAHVFLWQQVNDNFYY